MISVPKIHVIKLRVMILKLSIEIDNWRKVILILILIVILIVILNYPLKRIKGGTDGDNFQTLLMT